eukprot:6314150-Amphidinium_carterae.1
MAQASATCCPRAANDAFGKCAYIIEWRPLIPTGCVQEVTNGCKKASAIALTFNITPKQDSLSRNSNCMGHMGTT